MKPLPSTLLATLAACGYVFCAQAQTDTVLLDDTFADGTRNNTAYPTDSAWFASTASTLAATTGVLTGTDGTGSAMWLAYLGNAASSLGIGDTFKLSLSFNVNSVAPQNASRGVRIGLFDFTGGTRVTADTFSTGTGTGAPGAGVAGYMLNLNVGSTFGANVPIQITARTNISSVSLAGTSADFSAFTGTGNGAIGDPGISNSVPYVLTFAVTRTGSTTAQINSSIVGANLDVTNQVIDTQFAHFAFDNVTVRPNGNATGAGTWNFTEVRADLIGVPEPGAFALAGLGALGLAWRIRRSRG
jgi:hypothetical protein